MNTEEALLRLAEQDEKIVAQIGLITGIIKTLAEEVAKLKGGK